MAISNKNKEINFTGFRFKCEMTKENNALRITSQSGRSMVEMLGVLAVVGVLSIGGVMGYSYGMDKYRANQTMQDINLRGLDLIAQASRPGDINLSEWGTHSTIGYEWGEYGETEGQEGVVDMAISGLPKRVCEMVYDGMKNHVIGVDISGVRSDSNENCAEEDNEMVFYFGAGGTLGDSPTSCDLTGIDGCASCDEPAAIFDLGYGIATACAACENREMTSDGACILKECPDGYQRDVVGGCFRCEDNKAFVGGGDCSACEGYVPAPIGQFCTPNIECPEGYFLSILGRCLDCKGSLPYATTEEECAKCSNRVWEDSLCTPTDIESLEYPECPEGRAPWVSLLLGISNCISCDQSEPWDIESMMMGAGDCSKCPNRVSVERTYLCIKKCPDETPVADDSGNCYACDDPTSVDFSGPYFSEEITYFREQCGKCGSQRIVEDYKCRLNPCEVGEMWNGVSCDKICSSNKECPDGQLCLSDNTSCEQANYNTCKPYEVVDIGRSSYAKQVKIDGSENVSYWDAFGACRALGGYLDTYGDLVLHSEPYDAWMYSTTSCNANYGKGYAAYNDFNTAPKNSAVAKAVCVFFD